MGGPGGDAGADGVNGLNGAVGDTGAKGSLTASYVSFQCDYPIGFHCPRGMKSS